MSCFPLITEGNFQQSLQRSWEQSCCIMDILNKPINWGVHHAELIENWLNFFPPASCSTANALLLHFHLWAVLSPPVLMAQWWQWTPCLPGRGLRPFSDIASPISICVWDWKGKTRDFISLLSTLCFIGWCKSTMAPSTSGELWQLYWTQQSAPRLYNSLYGHAGTSFPAALLSKQPCHWQESHDPYGTVTGLEVRKHT